MTRVSGEEVEYIGWKAYGIAVHSVPVGANRICAKPLAGLAVIEPDWPLLRSSMTALSPSGVSCIVTARWSPEFINRSWVGSGVNVARVELIGLAGAWLTPFLVTKAKLKYSMPTCAAQVGFCSVPATGSSRSPKMLSAAHHLVGSHPLAPVATAHAGQGTQPGG